MLPDGIWIGLGGNQAGSEAAILRAVQSIGQRLRVRACSELYLTAPRDYLDQADFLNAVIHCDPPGDDGPQAPQEFLAFLLGLEREIGRRRAGVPPKGPRLIDLDLLLWGNRVIDGPELSLPHPAMHQRRFVLDPLLELAPGLCDPRDGRPWRLAREGLDDQAIYSHAPLGYTHQSL